MYEPKEVFLILRILTGSFLYAVGFNVFVVPFGLFSGGVVGAAQLICIPVARAFRLNAEQFISIVYILLNIPLFWIAWHDIGKPFLYKTILGVVSLALFLRLIPAATVWIEDELVSVLLGGFAFRLRHWADSDDWRKRRRSGYPWCVGG